MQKSDFFDGHKRKDIVEYKKKFLKNIKALFFYFIEFVKDGSILPKEYLEDCKIGGSN